MKRYLQGCLAQQSGRGMRLKKQRRGNRGSPCGDGEEKTYEACGRFSAGGARGPARQMADGHFDRPCRSGGAGVRGAVCLSSEVEDNGADAALEEHVYPCGDAAARCAGYHYGLYLRDDGLHSG